MRQINFPYDGETNEFAVIFDTELLLPFLAERAQEFPFTFDELGAVRDLLFSMGQNSNVITFPLAQKNIEDAILGVTDPYTLGELDDMSVNFKMWADQSGLVPDGLPGADGASIFSFVEPLFFLFQFINKYQGTFNVGDLFIDERGLVAQQIYLCLKAHAKLAQLASEKTVEGSAISMWLKHNKTALESCLTLLCKPLFGREWTLGEMDLLTLASFDPQTLLQLSRQAASILNLAVSSTVAEESLEPDAVKQNIVLRADSKPVAGQESFASAVGVSKRLSSSGYRGLALLGDIDDFALGDVDTRILGMHFYKKTPAIITADS